MEESQTKEAADVMSAENEERLQALRLIDDDFFSEVLDERIDAVQYILDVILNPGKLTVISTKSQSEYKNVIGRSIRLDVKAIAADGEIVDIEIQRAKKAQTRSVPVLTVARSTVQFLKKGRIFQRQRKHTLFS